jgi:uncharacterized membrane protein
VWAPWGWGMGFRWRRFREYEKALEVLRERFARGEITKEQFDQMLKDLEATYRVPGNI